MNHDPFSLEGKVALVTGSGRGLGRAMAEGLAQCGAHVVLNGRSGVRLTPVLEAFQAKGLSASIASFDISDRNAAEAALATIVKSNDRIDILVNNVGYRDRRTVFEFEPGAMSKMLELNLTAPFELSRLAARHMMKRNWGRIINISSVVAQATGTGDATYTAAKGGLESLTRALSRELGPHGITVNAIAPGFFATEANAEKAEDEAIAAWLKDRTALGRWARPEEIAGAAVFLASEAASYVCGQVIAVDGGMLGHL